MASKLNTLYNKHNVEHVIVTKYADLYPFPKRQIFGFAIKYIKRTKLNYDFKAIDFRDLVYTNSPYVGDFKVESEDIALIQYT